MRKYTGPRPTAICKISNIAQGIALIETNEGGKYFLHAKECTSTPSLGDDIYAWRFRRAQPVVFQQDVAAFHRMEDGYALPFAVYPGNIFKYTHTTLDNAERVIRRAFIEDMAKQGILARFQGDNT